MQAGTSIYNSLKERFEESLFEEAVFDHSSFDVIAVDIQEENKLSGEVRLDWIERQTATFMVRLPKNLQDLLDQEAKLQIDNLQKLLEKEIGRVKSAGIETIIEYVLKPFEETHEQVSELVGIESQVFLSEEQKTDESLRIKSEDRLKESHPTVDRLTVTSEIRSKETQSHDDKFEIGIDCKFRQVHEQLEKTSLRTETKTKESHLMKDKLLIQGFFNGTYFNGSYFRG
ncbi:MAG: hypothetical protein ABH870_06370 [bacterium]